MHPPQAPRDGLGDASWAKLAMRDQLLAARKRIPLPELGEHARALAAHLPAEGTPTLIHNDFKFDNLILTPELDRITGVLDWEMATLGDPRMDLGTSLSYWVEASDPGPSYVAQSRSRSGSTTGTMTLVPALRSASSSTEVPGSRPIET